METLSWIGWYFHLIDRWPGHTRCEVERNVEPAFDLGQLHPQIFTFSVRAICLLEAWDGLSESTTKVVKACFLDFRPFPMMWCGSFFIFFIDFENRSWSFRPLKYRILFLKLITCLWYLSFWFDWRQYYVFAWCRLLLAKYSRDRFLIQCLWRFQLDSWLTLRSLSFRTSICDCSRSEGTRAHTISAIWFVPFLLYRYANSEG